MRCTYVSRYQAVEIVGKVLIAVPTLTALVLLVYANITGNSIGISGSGFCIGTIIMCGLVLVIYAAVKEIKRNRGK
ncbi:MAG: hypothetical protein H0Z19_11405 [Archaeoglobus sp.]|uniref:hypothetical protein n=1 Tax=Archaeoglobus sp. TaxID=1872626 RepID=UPI001DA6505C|nr:hypothetical protein [Archaeoglobus sp.]MBO8181054.1 hypothetical protein [Archaeoglobus sp.]